MWKKIFYVFFLLLFILAIASIFTKDKIRTTPYNLKNDGCILLKNVLSPHDIETLVKSCKTGNYKKAKEYILQQSHIHKAIHKHVSKDYGFQDYILIIQKSAIHTCHRDYNGDLFNKGQENPSYTILIYLEDMEKCLGVIPKSHHHEHSHSINITNKLEHVACNKGDIFMFNANLIHVGALNEKEDNLRIQMKITHKEDVDILDYYEDYNKVLKQSNNLPKPLVKFQRDVSCMFPYLSTLTQTETKKNGVEKPQGWVTRTFSYLFYGNADFYNLKNAI